MESSDVTKIEDWIELQLKESWPDAESSGHENRGGDHYFQIRTDYRDSWLIVGLRAYRGLAVDELTKFLDEEHWLDRLQAEKCLRVQMPGLWPALVQPPELLV